MIPLPLGRIPSGPLRSPPPHRGGGEARACARSGVACDLLPNAIPSGGGAREQRRLVVFQRAAFAAGRTCAFHAPRAACARRLRCGRSFTPGVGCAGGVRRSVRTERGPRRLRPRRLQARLRNASRSTASLADEVSELFEISRARDGASLRQSECHWIDFRRRVRFQRLSAEICWISVAVFPAGGLAERCRRGAGSDLVEPAARRPARVVSAPRRHRALTPCPDGEAQFTRRSRPVQ